jgi:hypothetical protein
MKICEFQLKYHDAGKEKECLPQVGQWNMVNKVSFYFSPVCMSHVHFMVLDTLFTNKMNSTFAESDQWGQGKSLGMYKLLKECSGNHCARILPRVGTDVSNFGHGSIPLNCHNIPLAPWRGLCKLLSCSIFLSLNSAVIPGIQQ